MIVRIYKPKTIVRDIPGAPQKNLKKQNSYQLKGQAGNIIELFILFHVIL